MPRAWADAFSRRRMKEIAFVEQIIKIKFCDRLEKLLRRLNEMLKHVREGRESVEGDKRSRRPQTSRTTETIGTVSAAVHKNRLKKTAESVRISSATCQWILTKDLNMHMVCQHIVPRMLNEDQSAEEIKSAPQVELRNIAKNGFQKCFDDLYRQW
ncbi:hypothetical protein TNCV_5118001 [Trichonephila clavipes]|nr:hypothetical protein TNCV_5118001 [Trichonephila clavipes]